MALAPLDMRPYDVADQPAAVGHGSGAFYRAKERATSKRVGVLDVSNLEVGENQIRVLTKAQNNAHVPRLFASGLYRDHARLVMQLGGATLAQWQNGRAIPIDVAVRTIIAVLDGLSEVHRRGELHCDLHPGNVVKDGEDPQGVLVIDFGSARQMNERGVWTGDPFWGDRNYLPPERQYLPPDRHPGQKIELVRSSDLWEVGAMLIGLITGKRPFADGGDTKEGWDAVIQAGPLLPRTLDLRLAEVLRKAVAFDKKDRYQSAEEMIRALRPFALPSKDRILDYYADESVALARMGGLSGGAASLRREDHRRWAQDKSAVELGEELRRKISAQLERFGEKDRPKIARYYGETAVRQLALGIDLGGAAAEAPSFSAHEGWAKSARLPDLALELDRRSRCVEEAFDAALPRHKDRLDAYYADESVALAKLGGLEGGAGSTDRQAHYGYAKTRAVEALTDELTRKMLIQCERLASSEKDRLAEYYADMAIRQLGTGARLGDTTLSRRDVHLGWAKSVSPSTLADEMVRRMRCIARGFEGPAGPSE